MTDAVNLAVGRGSNPVTDHTPLLAHYSLRVSSKKDFRLYKRLSVTAVRDIYALLELVLCVRAVRWRIPCKLLHSSVRLHVLGLQQIVNVNTSTPQSRPYDHIEPNRAIVMLVA